MITRLPSHLNRSSDPADRMTGTHRETIEQLYRDDQLNLRDVKRIMERNYKFFASYYYPFLLLLLLLQHLHSFEYACVFIPYRSPPSSQYHLTPVH
jgi:hypothetical protein